MKTRLYTSIGIVLVLVLAFVLKMFVSSYFFDAFIYAITLVSAYEISKILSTMGKYNNKYVIMTFPALFLTVNIIGANFDSKLGIIWTTLIDVALIVLAFMLVFLFGIIFKKSSLKEMKIRNISENTSLTKFSFKKALNTSFGIIYPSFLLMFMVFINHFDIMTTSFEKVADFGGYLSFVVLLYTFLIPSITDTFAYLMGGLFGGKKLAPIISPKKTISGAVGGLFWCSLVSVCIYLILNAIPSIYMVFNNTGFAFWQILIISFIASIIAQLGDLFESLLKRRAGIKDSGHFLPGHGGMLDRCDSYIFVTPFLVIAFGILLLAL